MRLKKTSAAVVLCSTLLSAGGHAVKIYEVKSGKIAYSIKGSGEMLGQKMRSIGKKQLLFDHYGTQSLTEENKVEKQTIMGNTEITKSHTMTYMKEGVLYRVNFERKRIIRMENMAMAMMGGENMTQTGEKMMRQMGGKKTGTDHVLGYPCDVWELMGTKQCLYKGIPLRIESSIMGIKSSETATKAEFNLSLSKEAFTLPDFPVYDMQGNRIETKSLEAMDKASKTETEHAADEMETMRKAMKNAAEQAGIQAGKKPTKAQEQTMEEAMMAAMLPQIKQKIAKEEKVMQFGYSCLKQADTLKEANLCNQKANAMGGEPEAPFDEWSPKTKKETLDFLEKFLRETLPCMKKAQTFQALQSCSAAR